MTLSVLDPITPAEGTEALESLVGGDHPQVAVARLRLDRAAATTPEFADLGYFAGLMAEVGAVGNRAAAGPADRSAADAPDWSALSAEDRLDEIVTRMRTILARELRMPAAAVNVDQPFPELGLDSMTAMTMLKETQRLVGVEVSASLFWNHPTVASLSAHLADMLAPPEVSPEDTEGSAGDQLDSVGGVLDELFDHVESASAGNESGSF